MNNEETHKYDDIINLPHHVSARHPAMPLMDRAAQFSPFAALTGHEDAVRETARLTEDFTEPDEDRKEQMDRELRFLSAQGAEAEVTYFEPDLKKDGGAYRTVRGKVKKVDRYRRQLLFADGTALPMENIVAIEGELDIESQATAQPKAGLLPELDI